MPDARDDDVVDPRIGVAPGLPWQDPDRRPARTLGAARRGCHDAAEAAADEHAAPLREKAPHLLGARILVAAAPDHADSRRAHSNHCKQAKSMRLKAARGPVSGPEKERRRRPKVGPCLAPLPLPLSLAWESCSLAAANSRSSSATSTTTVRVATCSYLSHGRGGWSLSRDLKRGARQHSDALTKTRTTLEPASQASTVVRRFQGCA